jgi:hypothetical protein
MNYSEEKLSSNVLEFASQKLIPFLDDIKIAIQNKNISEANYNKLFDFYLSFQDTTQSNKLDTDDFMKFFTLGWYVYSNIKNSV